MDEAFQPCSIAAEIAAVVADQGFNSLDAPIKRLNGTFNPTPYTPTLENEVVPHVTDIVQAVQDLLKE